MRNLILILALAGCTTFAPAYDPAVNAKLAEIEVAAKSLKPQCMVLTPEVITDRIQVHVLELQTMTKYRSNSATVNHAADGIMKEVVSFKKMYVTEAKPSVKYCADKLDDIALTVDAILKPYGVLQ